METIDRAYRLWIAAIVAGMLVTIVALAFLVMPLVVGRAGGLDAFTAICRAFGIDVGKAAPAAAAVPPGATPQTKIAWTAAAFAEVAKGDRTAGEAIAQGTCIACHAADGSSADPAIPRLVGQSAFALYKELGDYANGARVNPIMAEIVKPLDAKQMADVTAYYAGLARKDLDGAHPSFAGPDIEDLVLRGDAARGLPPCAACHSPAAGGPLETPSLTGQSPAYVAAQLKAFADGSRGNDVFSRMRTIAPKLTAREMTLLGDYYTTPH